MMYVGKYDERVVEVVARGEVVGTRANHRRRNYIVVLGDARTVVKDLEYWYILCHSKPLQMGKSVVQRNGKREDYSPENLELVSSKYANLKLDIPEQELVDVLGAIVVRKAKRGTISPKLRTTCTNILAVTI